MAVTARRAVASAWPVVVLALFLGTFRRSTDHAGGMQTSATCDAVAPQRDVSSLERCLALDPGDVGVMTELGSAYDSAGHADRAEAMYRRALAADPRDAEVHLRLARLLLARGDRIAARAEGEAALRWWPGAQAPRDLIARASEGAP